MGAAPKSTGMRPRSIRSGSVIPAKAGNREHRVCCPPGRARVALIPAAFLLLADRAQLPFGAGALKRVPLAVKPGAQLLCLAAQAPAALAAARTVTLLAVTALAVAGGTEALRPRAAVAALQLAVIVADIADAAIDRGERAALLAAIGRAAPRD